MPDEVYCSFCKSLTSEWRYKRNPLKEHAWHSPYCPFLKFKNDKRVQHALCKGVGERLVFEAYKQFHRTRLSKKEFLNKIVTASCDASIGKVCFG